ncbi:Dysferlin limb girdle muscular dystrophy 2B (autosomal recessive) [Fasciolopsis buskii]|uniref:Dysferlin limb girdle muscular dystrophy 2B (Autosomal recessive) n=1 Tax=Fasciolopsis buskii TaxID=27845 RepID=A0A8E0VS18_9TREM|nr:Dysferlin limb girdle muscular dystrophy 2B (autosomal recessive) [Fasciolopsis buski]
MSEPPQPPLSAGPQTPKSPGIKTRLPGWLSRSNTQEALVTAGEDAEKSGESSSKSPAPISTEPNVSEEEKPSQTGTKKQSKGKSSSPSPVDVPASSFTSLTEKQTALVSQTARQPYSTKPQDFQIRVKVVEARQIQGGNVSPVCRITCWNRTEETHVKASTNSPYWNEIFFFNFHEAPATLLDQAITFSVYNSRHLRKDALIGSFKFDLAKPYEEKQHSMLNKWLLLSNPDDPMAGAKGYLKISIVILGPGDEAPSMKPTDADGDEDIEANLLRPAGVQLRPAVFKVRLYMAEDLPRMDPDTFKGLRSLMSANKDSEKKFVDPYMVLKFAGKTLKSSIKYETDHPEWHEELTMNLQFPSMCEKIKLTFYDWDKASEDDPIGTTTISLAETSSQGEDGTEGFLPTFGPCFVNLYGSTREYSDLPDRFEALNLGKGEGMAYRGRVLLELTTELLDEPVKNEVRPLEPDVIARIQKSLRRRKYKLFAAFYSASMISEEKDSPIAFEVSIGNHGNMLEDSVAPCTSTTPPTNPVYDGEAYSYLPWGDDKPCIVVDSQWEDISYRLCAINMFRRIADRLTRNIEKINVAVVAALIAEEQAQLAIASLDEFILDCTRPLPTWEPENSPENELDKQLRRVREYELKALREHALKARETVVSVDEALTHLKAYREVILKLSIEPQCSFPDIIVWMLSGNKRVAYHRIPAHEILYHFNEDFRGRSCGITQNIRLKKPRLSTDEENGFWKIPAQIRVIFWLGLEKEQSKWRELFTGPKLEVVAETYENQASIMGKWVTTRPPLTRPPWSDSTGRQELPKDSFKLPEGWKWDSGWFLSPEKSLLCKKDSCQTSAIEDLFYNETRTATNSWTKATPTYTDAQGELRETPDDFPLPDGWKWDDEWSVDFNRPCDDEGFEYTVDPKQGGYVATEKMYHTFRRRRIIRRRVPKASATKSVRETISTESKEHWEYAFNFDSSFHTKERKVDMVRRRRWHRSIRPVDVNSGGVSCVMHLSAPGSSAAGKLVVPRVYLRYSGSHTWHLRAYIFQARGLLGADDTGLSDPYVRCSFQGFTQRTETIMATLCPTWDETLIFDEVQIYGDPTTTAMCPPPVIVELFDWDNLTPDQFLGRCQIVPFIKLDSEAPLNCVLQWYNIEKGTKGGGELLAAFELILLDGKQPPLPPTRRGTLYNVPESIRPVLQRTGIEILCWGVRNVRKHQLASVNSPSVEFEIGGKVIESTIIKDAKRNPNFIEPLLFMDVLLPKEELYTPPMNICVRDHRAFGLRPLVGIHVLRNFVRFKVPPRTVRHDPLTEIPALCDSSILATIPKDLVKSKGESKTKLKKKSSSKNAHPSTTAVSGTSETSSHRSMKWKFTGFKKQKQTNLKLDLQQVDDDIDWWSKFYASMGQWEKCLKYKELGYDTLVVYNCSLEEVKEYEGFNDFCDTFTLSKGKNVDEDEDNFAGEFKGTFRIYPLPADPHEPLPIRYFEKLAVSPEVEECIVRIYIIRAIEIQPSDTSGLADPYVEIKLGDKKMSSKDNYVPNTLNPEFGLMFQIKCHLPIEKDLRIRIKDYDLLGTDDIIGETYVDLENRRLTKYRATCGLSQTYCLSGPNQWRDSRSPSEILADLCDYYSLPPPQYEEAGGTAYNCPTCRVGQKNFVLDQFERGAIPNPHLGPAKERLSLHILNHLPLVKEHVETRLLFSPLQPNIEQGKVQMWIDMFPTKLGEPGPPVDVSPRKPNEYELRVIVWNTEDVVLQETSITGEKMSDIYVKGWLAGIDERQMTDVHYRSLDGEGNFNWRFIFPFHYLPAENTMVVRRKEHFWSLDATETRLRPTLIMQVWDNDLFSADDFLGTLELNLASMPAPAKTAGKCNLNILQASEKGNKTINIFDSRRARGFWPFMNDENGEPELTGKIEMEIELLTKAEASIRPAGLAREEPNENPHLDPPNRPETSFFWLTSPWKTFKFIVWKRCKWILIGLLVAILLGLLIALFIYAMPGLLARKIVNV